MADEISVEASDVGYVEVIDIDPGFADVDVTGGFDVAVETEAPAEVVADAGPAVEAEPPDLPGFLAERGYGAATRDADAGPAPAAVGDDQTATAEAVAKAEGERIRQELIEKGTIKPAPEEPEAKAEAEMAKTPEEVEAWRKKLAELEAKDDESKAKKAEAEKPEKPSWQQRLKTGAQKASSGLRKAASGASKGLRKASSGLKKRAAAPKPAASAPKAKDGPKGGTPKTQATPKAAGPSTVRKLGQSLGNLAGAPRRLAQGLREALPKSTPKPAEKPAQSTPRNPGPGAVSSLGRALGNLAGAPRRLAEGVKQTLPKAQTKEEPPGKPGDKPVSKPVSQPPGGGGLPSPGAGITNLGRALPLGLAGLAVAFLVAGGMARTTQAVGGVKATPLVVIAAALFAATILLMLFRR